MVICEMETCLDIDDGHEVRQQLDSILRQLDASERLAPHCNTYISSHIIPILVDCDLCQGWCLPPD